MGLKNYQKPCVNAGLCRSRDNFKGSITKYNDGAKRLTYMKINR
jgi:hypothetical protein